MKMILIVPLVAALIAGPALAEPVTKTVTRDGPKYDSTRTTVRDKEAGTLSRDATVTRDSDGATATRSYDRARTDTGATASGSRTGFNGKTSTFDLERTKTANGSTTVGTATGPNGGTLNYTGSRERTDHGYTANQTVVNGHGTTVYDRNVSQTRADGQVTRSVDVTRAAGFHPRHSFGGHLPGRRGY